jgi:Spy/CpxP family protein refolding chaperone
MDGLSRWKSVLLVLATFVVGAVTGALLVMGSAKDEMLRQQDPRLWFSNTPQRWISEMQLTPDQEQKIRPILHQIDDELKNLRALDLRETDGILSRGKDRITRLLNPDQREKMDKAFERRKQRVREWLGIEEKQERNENL